MIPLFFCFMAMFCSRKDEVIARTLLAACHVKECHESVRRYLNDKIHRQAVAELVGPVLEGGKGIPITYYKACDDDIFKIRSKHAYHYIYKKRIAAAEFILRDLEFNELAIKEAIAFNNEKYDIQNRALSEIKKMHADGKKIGASALLEAVFKR